MTTRKLKWVGLGDSEYVSKDGEFLVQLQDRTWHLFRRVTIESEGRPTWTWSDSLFTSKRKGECQDAAEESPEAEAPEAEVVPGEGRGARPGLTNYDSGTSENTNATCWCCGVAFSKPEKGWQFGDLCGTNCMDLMVDVLSDVKALG
jgi:hypothetical protein